MSCPAVIKVITPGPPGPAGPTGPAGVGSTWRQAAGAPSGSIGVVGDFYLNTSNGDIYGPKTSGGWGSVIFNIAQGQTGPQGPVGATGATGPAGANGYTILSGSGAPSGSTGVNGDFYIDTTGWIIYGPKAGGAWPAGASLIGPAGATGATGAQGPAGPTGPAGTPASYSDATPQPLGSAAAGTVAAAARADHVHALPTPAAIGAVATNDGRLSDAREWSADTITQTEAEAGTATTRRAFTATRVFQAISAWWAASAAKTKLDGVAAGATANATDAQLRDRSTHTGTQAAGTITGLATVATSGAYGDLTGRPTLGTSAALDVAAAGDAASGQVVRGNDSRLSDARTPTAHTHAASSIRVSTAAGRALLTAADAAAQRISLGLGTAATTDASAYATAAQGAKADTAVQPGSLATVATTGSYADLSSKPTIPSLSDATPQAPGTAAAGTASSAARGDHVHPLPAVVSTSAAGLAPATSYASITYAADVELDMAALDGQLRTINLTGNLSLTSINRAAGRRVVLRLICDSTQRTLTFPSGWVFVGSKPANIAASKTGILSLTFFGTASTDAVVAWAVQS